MERDEENTALNLVTPLSLSSFYKECEALGNYFLSFRA